MPIDPSARDTSVDHGLRSPAAERFRFPKVGGLSFAFALLLFAVAAINGYPSVRASSFAHVEGRVVGFKFDQEGWERRAGSEGRAREVWFPRIHFRTLQGEEVEMVWPSGLDVDEGDIVPLLVDPEGVHDPQVDLFGERWQTPLLVFLAGMLAMVVSWWANRREDDLG